MPTVVNMLAAKSSLSKLVHALESGDESEFIIARAGRPAARLVPLHAPSDDRSRRIGAAEGRFTVPEDIDASNNRIAELFGVPG